MAKTKKKKRDAKARKKAIKAATRVERRVVTVRVSRWIEQYADVDVAVPAAWTDADVAAQLHGIYEEVTVNRDHLWVRNGDEEESEHHLIGTTPAKAHMIFDRKEANGEPAEA
jgi:nucleotide-binding universal stress UspA family protein